MTARPGPRIGPRSPATGPAPACGRPLPCQHSRCARSALPVDAVRGRACGHCTHDSVRPSQVFGDWEHSERLARVGMVVRKVQLEAVGAQVVAGHAARHPVMPPPLADRPMRRGRSPVSLPPLFSDTRMPEAGPLVSQPAGNVPFGGSAAFNAAVLTVAAAVAHVVDSVLAVVAPEPRRRYMPRMPKKSRSSRPWWVSHGSRSRSAQA